MSFKWNNVNRAVDRLTLVGSALPVLIGLLVLAGWHFHLEALTQVRFGYVAMVYNTALALVAAGLGVWASMRCRRLTAFACAGFLSILGALSAAESVFGLELGIDQLFMAAYNNVSNPHPGRMALNTAVCLMLVGVSMVLGCSRKSRRHYLMSLGVLGTLISAIASIPFIGYLLGIPTAYTWGATALQMAVHTAVALMSLGIAISALAWSRSQEVETGPPEWFPALAGIGGLGMTLLLWQALVAQNRQEMKVSIEEVRQAAEARITGTLKAYISPIERLAPMWEQRTLSELLWKQKASRWLDAPEAGGFAAILSVDPRRHVWIASTGDRDYTQLLAKAAAVAWNSSPKSDWETHVKVIRTGGGVAVVIRSRSMPGAFVLGDLRFARSLDSQMNHGLSRAYNVLLSDGDEVVYQRDSQDRANVSGGAEELVRFLNANWKLSVWPSSARMNSESFVLPYISLGVGSLVSLLLAFAMWLIRRSHFRTLQLEAAQRDLQFAHEGLELKIRERTDQLAGANLELGKTAQHYTFMADSMPQIVWTSKPDGNLDYYNQRWFDYTGLSFEQTKDWGWQPVLHPDDLHNCIERWTRSFTTGAPYEVEYRFKRGSDGVYRWHLGRAAPMYNQAGEIIRWFGTCTDIDDFKRAEAEIREARSQLEVRVQERTADLTVANASLQAEIGERQLAERQLRDQKEQFRLTLETANDAFVCIDAGGCIIEWNRQAVSTFGWSKQEAIGQKLDALLIPPEYREAHRRGMARYLNSGEASVLNQTSQLPALHRSGTVIPLEVTIWPVRDGGQVRFNAFLRDIAHRKQMEEDLRRNNLRLKEKNRQVEEASRMKSAFLANMSHELRTPLNGIIGFSELMVDGITGPVSPAQKECLSDVLSNSRHLLGLINDVLDVAKVESGTLVFKPQSIAVSDLVHQAVSGLGPLALQKNIQLETCVDPGAAHVYLDPQKLKQVLLNYLSNAVKFTPANGTVKVSVRPDQGPFFRLEVADSGIGIAEQDIGRLFQEFQQLDGGASKQFQGTGLGLALTKRLVDAQGGHVGVKSTLGQGSVFFAILPMGQASACPVNLEGVSHG